MVRWGFARPPYTVQYYGTFPNENWICGPLVNWHHEIYTFILIGEMGVNRVWASSCYGKGKEKKKKREMECVDEKWRWAPRSRPTGSRRGPGARRAAAESPRRPPTRRRSAPRGCKWRRTRPAGVPVCPAATRPEPISSTSKSTQKRVSAKFSQSEWG